MHQHTTPSPTLSEMDHKRLHDLRRSRPAHSPPLHAVARPTIADRLTNTVGSWRFIVIQSVLLSCWILLNVVGVIRQWDPYPFILLNLVLSFQAAYTAPIIMMSQNRQAEIDRRNAQYDYQVNIKAELEIEALHAKVDALREQEILRLTQLVERLSAQLDPRG